MCKKKKKKKFKSVFQHNFLKSQLTKRLIYLRLMHSTRDIYRSTSTLLLHRSQYLMSKSNLESSVYSKTRTGLDMLILSEGLHLFFFLTVLIV